MFYIIITKGVYQSPIWWNFTWAVKNLKFCIFMGSFCSNHIKFRLKEWYLTALRSDAKVKEKLTYGFKYDMKNFCEFSLNHHYHPCLSKFASRIHPFMFLYLSYFFKFHRALSLSTMFVALSLKPLYSIVCGKNFQIYSAQIPRMHLFEAFLFMSLPTQKSPPASCHHALRQKEITHSPRQHSFENLFLPTAKRCGGNYDFRKNEHELEH